MAPSRSVVRRLGITVRWPLGVVWTSWRYLWRTTPLHRRECTSSPQEDSPPPLPAGVERDELQTITAGVGPLFYRRYVARVRDAELSARKVMALVQADPDVAAPWDFAKFVKTHGEAGEMRVGDEYLVRMAGPWDGPVRVIEVDDTSFRLATLEGHLEAGQIRFSASDRDNGLLELRIDSWARSGDRFVHLLYHYLRMAKEVQFHMWTSYIELLAKRAGGRLAGGVDVETHRVEEDVDVAC